MMISVHLHISRAKLICKYKRTPSQGRIAANKTKGLSYGKSGKSQHVPDVNKYSKAQHEIIVHQCNKTLILMLGRTLDWVSDPWSNWHNATLGLGLINQALVNSRKL